jgi:putative 4-mercaptohistidine N1-methyltranferase
LTVSSLYESPKLLGEYLLLHYGGVEEIGLEALPVDQVVFNTPFPLRCVRWLLATDLLPKEATALELGCSVAAAAFELARTCAHVEASDYSASFINAAEQLKQEGRLDAIRVLQGDRTEPFTAVVPTDIDRSRVSFSVQDATALPEPLGPFDVVLAANLLCRLPDPEALLKRFTDLVKPGGQLLLTTPFTWLEEFTPRDRWIGGGLTGPSSEEELTRRLSPHFRLHRRIDLPFLIREHERKYQLGIALGTSWIRQ